MTDINKHAPFLAEGKSREIVEAFWQQRSEVAARQKMLTDEVGALNAVTQGGVIGFVFENDEHPDGWKKVGAISGKNYFAPTKRTDAGKAIRTRMAELRMPGASDFHGMFPGVGFGIMDGRQGIIRWMTYDIINDDTVVILVPRPSNPSEELYTPPDAKPLKMSEYWALKEVAEETGS